MFNRAEKSIFMGLSSLRLRVGEGGLLVSVLETARQMAGVRREVQRRLASIQSPSHTSTLLAFLLMAIVYCTCRIPQEGKQMSE